MQMSQIMMSLIGNAVCGKEIATEQMQLSVDDLEHLYKLSKRHDLAPLVGYSLISLKLLPEGEIKERFKKQMMTAVLRYECMEHDLQSLTELFESAAIPMMPLKGAVIRRYYPEPWMRTSCDIDILIKDSDFDVAVSLLLDNGLHKEHEDSHEISFVMPSGTHIELHHTLIEDGLVKNTADLLENVWDTAILQDGCKYRYMMTNEMFIFYHIVHMAKHFQYAGCGVRPFLDLWLIEHKTEYDAKKLNELIEKSGLSAFADNARQLSEVWFETREHTETTAKTEQYIIKGGMYGTDTNVIVVQRAKKGGKHKYALSKIYLPYEAIKKHYPILEKYRWLTPIMQLRRWGKIIFCGGLWHAIRELRANHRISNEDRLEMKRLFESIGL